jgi:hypothetical protein
MTSRRPHGLIIPWSVPIIAVVAALVSAMATARAVGNSDGSGLDVEVVTNTITSAPPNNPGPPKDAIVTAQCPSGKVVTGGGGRVFNERLDSASAILVASFPTNGSPPTAWQAIGRPPAAQPQIAYDITVYAVCVRVSAAAGTLPGTTPGASIAAIKAPDDDRTAKLTDDQRRQHQRTDRSGSDDVRTEGNVIATGCDTDPPTLSIANRDGTVVLTLLGGASKSCGAFPVGSYLVAEGEKVNEQRFDAYEVGAG